MELELRHRPFMNLLLRKVLLHLKKENMELDLHPRLKMKKSKLVLRVPRPKKQNVKDPFRRIRVTRLLILFVRVRMYGLLNWILNRHLLLER